VPSSVHAVAHYSPQYPQSIQVNTGRPLMSIDDKIDTLDVMTTSPEQPVQSPRLSPSGLLVSPT
jgi:hypothetical protein